MLFSCFALGIVLNISRGPKVDSLEPVNNETETENKQENSEGKQEK
jgi:hypothetical protein